MGIIKGAIILRDTSGRFQKGHTAWNKGKKGVIPSWNKGLTKETDKRLKKMSDKVSGKKNHKWKGDEVGYFSLHDWIKNHKLKPKLCERCNKAPPFDLANISGQYKRNINDFEWICRKCHMIKDGRMNNLKQGIRYANQMGKLIQKPYEELDGVSYANNDTCPKCEVAGSLKATKHYRICMKCGHIQSRLKPSKDKRPEGVIGLK